MITGSMVALITPFHEDGSVNYDKLGELIEWHIQQQTDAILVLGTTAETPALTVTEEDEIARISIEAAGGRVPIIVGSGSNNTMIAMEQSIKYEKMGADALLVITPYYNKTNKSGMVNHFYTVADAVNIPIYVYNVPGRTGVSLTYEALAEISKHKNIVGIKEASGDISFITKISRLINDDFNMYSGNDDISIPLMSMGGAGIISVLANILPKETKEGGGNAEILFGLHQRPLYRNQPDSDQGSHESGGHGCRRISDAVVPDGRRYKSKTDPDNEGY